MKSIHTPVYYYIVNLSQTNALFKYSPHPSEPTSPISTYLAHQNLLAHQYPEEPGYANPMETELDMPHRSSHMSAVQDVNAAYSTLDPNMALYASLDLVLQPLPPVLLDLVLQPTFPVLVF